MRIDRLVLSGLLLAVAGCTVGPDYTRPQITTAPSFHAAAKLSERADVAGTPPPLDRWWQGFHDPELVRIVDRVLVQNLDLQASQARVAQARAAADYAGANRLPQGALDGDAAHFRQSTESPLGKIASAFPGYTREQNLADLDIGASWETDLAGGLRRAAQQADAEYQAAEASHAGTRISLAAEAADAYFRVREAQARIAIAQDQVRNEQGLLQLVDLRASHGLGTARETAQSEALLLQTQATLPPLQQELSLQLNRLDVLMGAAPGTYAAELIAPDDSYTVPALDVTDGPAALLRRRPDVIAAERRVAASNASIGVAMAQYYPSVSLSGLAGFSSLDTGKLFTGAAFQPEALLGLHWRLFDFGRVDAQVRAARGSEAEALADYRATMLRATEEVEDSLITLAQTDAQHQLLRREVNAHERARAAAEDAYKGGAVSLIEVLDEDRQLLAARDQLASTRAGEARAAVATFRALGGGWQGAAQAPDKLAALP